MLAEMMMGNAKSTAKVKNNLPRFRKGLAPYTLDYSGHWGFSVPVPTGSHYLGYGKRPVPFATIAVNHSFNKELYEIFLCNTDGDPIQLDMWGSNHNLSNDPEQVIDTIKHLMATGYLVPDDVQGGAP